MTSFDLNGRVVSGASGGRPLADDGPLVVLVHGAGMDRTVWSLQTRWLAHHGVSALAIDLPGHGASTEPERSSIEDYADWLAEVVEAADRPVHLVGHSMGTFIVLETARRATVASVTLVGTAAAMPVHPALIDAAAADDPLAGQLMSGWAFSHATRTGAHPSPGGSMIGATQALISQSASGVLHNDLTMCAAYEGAVEAAAALTIPATFLLGSNDRMTPVRNARAVIEAVNDPRVEIVDGVGHMVQIEAPAVTRRIVAETVAAA